MKLDASTLREHLQRGPRALYAIHGIDPLVAEEAGDLLRAAARAAGATERVVFTAEAGFDWTSLAAASSSLSLFAARRLIELRIPSGKPGKEGGAALVRLVTAPPGDDITLISFPELDWSTQKSEWFQAVSARALLIEARPVARDQLPKWLATRLAEQGQSVSDADLEWLADQVEGNLMAASQEVQKLALNRPPGVIGHDDLVAAVTRVARYASDDLLGAIHRGDTPQVARAIDSLKSEGEAVPLLIWQLSNETREAWLMARSGRASRPFPPQRIRQLEALARRHGAARLARLMLQAHQIDRMMKGVGDVLTGADPWAALTELALRLAGKATLRPLPT
jgi:DNA polymerase-3 subunit delta